LRNDTNHKLFPPPGLRLAHDFVSQEEEEALIALVEASGLSYSEYDPGNLRSSSSYGWEYNYGDDSFFQCEALPAGFHVLRDRAADFAGIDPDTIAQCLLNRYEPGAVIQWHFDKPVWEHVLGVSLGAPSTMHFRRAAGDEFDFAAAALLPRSLYFLSNEARYKFQHSLPPAEGTRWSITFRTFSDLGRKLCGFN